MTVRIGQFSRLGLGAYLTLGGVEYWDFIDYPPPVVQSDDIIYQVEGSDRFDTIAHRFYGQSSLWWVIALANDLELVPFGVLAGDQIRIPSPRYIFQVYFPSTRTR